MEGCVSVSVLCCGRGTRHKWQKQRRSLCPPPVSCCPLPKLLHFTIHVLLVD